MTGVQTGPDCLPCLRRQGLDAIQFATGDIERRTQALREVQRSLDHVDFALSPATASQRLHRRIRELTGHPDPYRSVKSRSTMWARELVPELSVLLERVQDPLEMALRLAVAANSLDFGAPGGADEVLEPRLPLDVEHHPFHGDVREFARAVAGAREVLYLADNAGELVFDELLIRRIGAERVTLVVRGGPVLNDATITDALESGLSDLVPVMTNGSDAPGTLLGDASDAFRRRFARADLIIAKGQGNHETLTAAAADIFFLFKVKCPRVAAHTGLPQGTHAVLRSAHRSGTALP